MREIILDTETTGLRPLDGHRVIEIGAVEMFDRVITGREFHTYINPERSVPEEAYRIHGLSSEFLQDKPLFCNVVDGFLEFIDGAKLVIHNAQFDINFLNYELSLIGKSPIDMKVAIDTLALARRKFPGTRVNLDALCKRFKIDNTARDKHGALLDSQLLAEVYIELMGGRQTTFSLKGESSSNIRNISNPVEGNGVVIMPDEEEKRQHAIFMEKLRT